MARGRRAARIHLEPTPSFGTLRSVAWARRPAEVPDNDLLTEQEVVAQLGLSTNRVRWLTMNGHLQRGVTPERGSAGLTKESVEHERVWRASATRVQRLRRTLGYAFVWMP
jgi:hypothetical protein